MKRILATIVFLTVTLSACTPPPPEHRSDVCKIFKQYPSWYWDAQDSQKKWGVPVYVQMAIIYQESRFQAKAKPARGKVLWVIPWKRPSSAYGYSQALDGTWEKYEKANGNGNRTTFHDATDFIGWYGSLAHKKAGIPKNDAYKLYLAYHEGIGGYQRGTYRKKQWLINVSKKVEYRSQRYQRQLWSCESKLKKKPWWKKVF